MRFLGLAVVVGLVALAGCDSILDIQDHALGADAAPSTEAGASSSGGDSSAGAQDSGGDHDAGFEGGGSSSGTNNDSGGLADSGEPADSGADAFEAGVCTTGALSCNGNTPQQCVGGSWQAQSPCAGAMPVCSNGACGTFRTTGGIRSTGVVPTALDAGIRLVSGGFEVGTRTCDSAGVCVTGGIVP